MAQLAQVEQLPTIEREGSARVAGPIVEDFVASGFSVAKVEREEGDAKPQSMKAILQKYIETREVDASVFVRNGEVYLQRGRKETKSDTNGDGTE